MTRDTLTTAHPPSCAAGTLQSAGCRAQTHSHMEELPRGLGGHEGPRGQELGSSDSGAVCGARGRGAAELTAASAFQSLREVKWPGLEHAGHTPSEPARISLLGRGTSPGRAATWGPERPRDVGAEETHPEQSGSEELGAGPGVAPQLRVAAVLGRVGTAWDGRAFRGRAGVCCPSSDVTCPPRTQQLVPGPAPGRHRPEGLRALSRRRAGERPERPPAALRACPRPRATRSFSARHAPIVELSSFNTGVFLRKCRYQSLGFYAAGGTHEG